MTMAHIRKLPSRASATYWLPRAAARAKPFQCCPCRVWRCLRRGSGLPAGSGAPANPKRCARHAPSSAPPHETVTRAVVALLCRPPRVTDDANAPPACACAGGVCSLARRTCLRPRAILVLPHRKHDAAAFVGLPRSRFRDRLPPTSSRRGRTTPCTLGSQGKSIFWALNTAPTEIFSISLQHCCPNFEKPCSPLFPPPPLIALPLIFSQAGLVNARII